MCVGGVSVHIYRQASESCMAVLCGNEKLQWSVASFPLNASEVNVQQEQNTLLAGVSEAAFMRNEL